MISKTRSEGTPQSSAVRDSKRQDKWNNEPKEKRVKMERDYRYGYLDDSLNNRPFRWRPIFLILAIIFLVVCWLFLTQKILFGDSWLSATYDNIDWRTNEGNLQTYGAWDLEAHIWKSEFIMENWPNVMWNPYWYLGMPLFKYYQPGFYAAHIAVIQVFGVDSARAANLLIIFGHLAAVLLTFLLCLRISRRYFVASLVAFFLLANSFMSLRSYGWEPITVVFLALYPLGLLVFLREPLRPFRFWMAISLAAAYIMHPLIWFSLCMTIGLYLFTIAISASKGEKTPANGIAKHKIFTQYTFLVLSSLLLGGFQAVNQFSYNQVTSGAHMGIKYLPLYHVTFNIITLKEFLFDYNNLKGPGPIIGLALLFLIVFVTIDIFRRRKERKSISHESRQSNKQEVRHNTTLASNSPADTSPTFPPRISLLRNTFIYGFAFILFIMILFYYFEYFNFFPMNLLRSIQYHRIIPEFIIAAACLIAALSTQLRSKRIKVFYYLSLISFVIGGLVIIYTIQLHWETAPSINEKPEFINEKIPGRISMPYTEQSLSVRNSFTRQPQIYGYYEQGITNPYTDEMFSVSSGFHNANLTILYLRSADVSRLYINREAGVRNIALQQLLNGTLPFTEGNERYAYFSIPIGNPSFAQAVPTGETEYVASLEPQCRVLFHQEYCGSEGEEFVSKDYSEARYLQAYVNMLENHYENYNASAEFTMIDPDHYRIDVENSTVDTAVVIKMTNDRSWDARIGTDKLVISDVGPGFMIVHPQRSGKYTIALTYKTPIEYIIGMALTVMTFIGLCVYFIKRPAFNFDFPQGDMERQDRKERNDKNDGSDKKESINKARGRI